MRSSCLARRNTSVGKINVEINEELLAAVQRALSTVTIKDTIEKAFREVLRVKARREEVAALAAMSGQDLANPSLMAGAWRQ